MALTEAYISQCGDQMKSMLAIARAIECVRAGLDVSIIDIDTEHRTSYKVMEQRNQQGIEPICPVKCANTAQEALSLIEDEDLVIIDTPSRATRATLHIAQNVDLIVHPTTAGKKNLDLEIETAYQLVQNGVPIERMVFILTRIDPDSSVELLEARAYLESAVIDNQKFRLLSDPIYERRAYRRAVNDGFTITETSFRSLNDSAKNVLHQLSTILFKISS